jgi:hypothetical protein
MWTFSIPLFVGVVTLAPVTLCYAQPLPPAPARVQTFTDQGMEFAVVRTHGMRPLPTYPDGGRDFNVFVPDFAITRAEVVEAQILEFHNSVAELAAATDAPNRSILNGALNGLYGSIGAVLVGHSSIGRPLYGALPEAFDRSIRNVRWYTAVMYCNWLHNNRQNTWDAITTGAYDLTNLRDGQPSSALTVTRAPDARYWLPSDAEWSIATYWDPQRVDPLNPGAQPGGWWSYSYGRDRPPISGLPAPDGQGETSYGTSIMVGGFLPVGAYADQQSPWGLVDTSGGAREWLDTSGAYAGTRLFDADRLVAGTELIFMGTELERLRNIDQGTGSAGFRVAMAIPAPGACGSLICVLFFCTRRARNV